MKTISQYSHAYFLGIGGIGMSAICRYLHEVGLTIGGYDKTRTELTDSLQDLGIQISFDDSVSAFPDWIESHHTDTLFIITPAIPAHHPQRIWLEKKQIPVYKRAEVLGIITRNTRCLAVAGTHGKTTTSSLLAHILGDLQLRPTLSVGMWTPDSPSASLRDSQYGGDCVGNGVTRGPPSACP